MTQRAKIAWEGSQQLRRLLVDVADLAPHPDNPRRGDLDVIEESLRTFGQVRPILVNSESGYIVAGNHTFLAARDRLGWNRVAVVKAKLSPELERKYLLMDNRASDLGEYDQATLARVLVELGEAGELAGTGYSGEDVDKILAEHDQLVRESGGGESDGDGGNGDGERPPLSGARHVVLMLDPKKHEKFGRYLSMLSRELGTDGPSETVYRVVEKAAKAL